MELETLKALLGITDNTKDTLLQFTISDVEETIKNFCNIDKVPEGLFNTGYRMCLDLYRNENLGSEEGALGSISSISEGDTSTSFRSNIAEFKDSLLKNYQAQLIKYRKLVW
ncbi:MAG: phage head-tail connector protein [Clostridium neonatale]